LYSMRRVDDGCTGIPAELLSMLQGTLVGVRVTDFVEYETGLLPQVKGILLSALSKEHDSMDGCALEVNLAGNITGPVHDQVCITVPGNAEAPQAVVIDPLEKQNTHFIPRK
jgi:hypothetical protein